MRQLVLICLLLATCSAENAVPPKRPLDRDLATALDHQDARRVRLLLRQGAGVQVNGDRGRAVLMLAAGRGDVALIREALKRGADVNVTEEPGTTPLDWGQGGMTPLLWAADCGHAGAVRELLAHGAEVDARTLRDA